MNYSETIEKAVVEAVGEIVRTEVRNSMSVESIANLLNGLLLSQDDINKLLETLLSSSPNTFMEFIKSKGFEKTGAGEVENEGVFEKLKSDGEFAHEAFMVLNDYTSVVDDFIEDNDYVKRLDITSDDINGEIVEDYVDNLGRYDLREHLDKILDRLC